MKHKPIIQANLDKLTTKKEKITYLLYAYKEWLIGLSISLIAVVSIGLSIANRQMPDFTVRFLTEEPVGEETMAAVKAAIQEVTGTDTLLDVQNYLVGSPEQVQMLLAQTAAKDIDVIVSVKNPSIKAESYLKDLAEERNIFTLDVPGDFVYSSVFRAPHPDLIAALKKAHPSH